MASATGADFLLMNEGTRRRRADVVSLKNHVKRLSKFTPLRLEHCNITSFMESPDEKGKWGHKCAI